MNIDYYRQLLRMIAEELNVKQVITPKLVYTLEDDKLWRRENITKEEL